MDPFPFSNQLLGYSDDARLLILNADDFGMCNSSNEAIFRALEFGLVKTTTLMVPCPWARQAMRYLQDHPNTPFGVHLTALSDSETNAWKPLTPRERVPTLVDEDGYFYPFRWMDEYLAQVDLGELETEFRAQIETVLRAGLRPTHLDWHSIRIHRKPAVFDLIFRLAREYGLAARAIGQGCVETVRRAGLPTADQGFLDSYMVEVETKPARYAQMLRDLPPGLSEWGVHPAFDNLELLALEPSGNHIRQTDYDFWTSQQAREIIAQEGIVLLDYRKIQDAWKSVL